MGKRNPNPKLVKIHRNYTVEEISSLYKVHKNTVREWIKRGLSVMDEKRPMLILGCDLYTYLQAQRTKNKCPCKPNQMYCFKCRAPKTPAGNMVDYQSRTEGQGNLFGICPDCETGMNRATSLKKLQQIGDLLDISLTEDLPNIVDINQPTLNSDFR